MSHPKDWIKTYIQEKERTINDITSSIGEVLRQLATELLTQQSDLHELQNILFEIDIPGTSRIGIANPSPIQVDAIKAILDTYDVNIGIKFAVVYWSTIEDYENSAQRDALCISFDWWKMQQLCEATLGSVPPLLVRFEISDNNLFEEHVEGLLGFDLRDLRIVKRVFNSYWDNAKTWAAMRS